MGLVPLAPPTGKTAPEEPLPFQPEARPPAAVSAVAVLGVSWPWDGAAPKCSNRIAWNRPLLVSLCGTLSAACPCALEHAPTGYRRSSEVNLASTGPAPRAR